VIWYLDEAFDCLKTPFPRVPCDLSGAKVNCHVRCVLHAGSSSPITVIKVCVVYSECWWHVPEREQRAVCLIQSRCSTETPHWTAVEAWITWITVRSAHLTAEAVVPPLWSRHCNTLLVNHHHCVVVFFLSNVNCVWLFVHVIIVWWFVYTCRTAAPEKI